ncbi:endonuclease/exonuclease/phosphatase family protein [Arthrobacter sp. I2-34]|uniref:Endonuclease/exonuclease/phosphatase family protein n=1 Tax=Arthrobacter hankyongi TaxID=2904801 RepID=A0ABS9L6L2_9MICC|nr:endonuclease/exonuclease/phosphatase family protein [Arthrobacter hankyongi]MCG2622266.1 endonuclease/exonuclease/phosphatase family protein [Arthrobacter hankyongi]
MSGATGYTVRIATNPKFTSGRKTFKPGKASQKVTKLRNCTTYYFKVNAHKGSAAGGAYSATSKVTLNCYGPEKTSSIGKFSTITVKPKSGTSIGISWSRPKSATRYELWRSTSTNFSTDLAKVKTSKTWYIDQNLKASTPGKSYYYRILAFKSGSSTVRYSTKFEANLAPGVPGGARVLGTSASGATLAWNASTNARQYVVRTATDQGFTQNVKTFTTTDGRNRLAVNTLTAGRKYFFQVKAVNGNKQHIASSRYGASVSATTLASGTPLTVMSFNVLTANLNDGIASHNWTTRKPAVVNVIGGSGADVVGVQEAYATVSYPGVVDAKPQWEDLRQGLVTRGYERALSGTDGLYGTQCGGTGCAQDEYLQDGNHIFYRTSTVRPIGSGGRIQLTNPDNRTSGYTAVWQVFEKRDGSGVRFLAVDTHLYWQGINVRGSFEAARTKQAQSLVAALNTVNRDGLPVILLGDFNSKPYHDPITAIEMAGYSDAAGVDVPQTKATYNSFHGFRNPPPHTWGNHIDFVFLSPDVSAKKWELLANIDLTTGKFVGAIPSDHHALRATLTLPK